MSTPLTRRLLPAALALCLAALCLVVPADGAMRSKQLDTGLCETTGGGAFVKIPGFPGERIDRRLLSDVRWLVRRYKIFITDGYSTDPVHSSNGEHPRGLALDIVPDVANGGSWKKIDRLARWAEPKQNQPRAPFRWVGYDGDSGHGSGNHLHLSWSHSETGFDQPARTVYSVKCPTKKKPPPANPDDGGNADDGPDTAGGIGGNKDSGRGDDDGSKKDDGRDNDGDGGGGGGIGPGDGGGYTGGIGARSLNRIAQQAGSSASVETGGVGYDAR
jgi:hypothetical protein